MTLAYKISVCGHLKLCVLNSVDQLDQPPLGEHWPAIVKLQIADPSVWKSLKFLNRNRCQSHLCVLFLFFFCFCERTSAEPLFITALFSTSLVLSSLQSAANTQIKSLSGFMNPLWEVDSEGVLKGAGRTHMEVSRPYFSEGGQGQGLFFLAWIQFGCSPTATATHRPCAGDLSWASSSLPILLLYPSRVRWGRDGGTAHTDWL